MWRICKLLRVSPTKRIEITESSNPAPITLKKELLPEIPTKFLLLLCKASQGLIAKVDETWRDPSMWCHQIWGYMSKKQRVSPKLLSAKILTEEGDLSFFKKNIVTLIKTTPQVVLIKINLPTLSFLQLGWRCFRSPFCTRFHSWWLGLRGLPGASVSLNSQSQKVSRMQVQLGFLSYVHKTKTSTEI